MMQFPSELPFASFLQYSPRGTSDASRQSQRLRDTIKFDRFWKDAPSIDYAAKRLAELKGNYPFLENYLGPETTAIPMPRSSPLQNDALWPSLRICQALLAENQCAFVHPCLMRIKPVQKSAYAGQGQRPSPLDHFDSFKVIDGQEMAFPTRITLIDDFITRGSTFMGAYAALKECFPAAEIRCFALVRTISPGEVQNLLAPVEGNITFSGENNLRRRP